MSAFRDLELAVKTAERVRSLVHRDMSGFLLSAAESASRPDQAVVNFERWIASTGSPTTVADSVLGTPELGRLLVSLLGASHQVADVLVQNPELAFVVLDPALLYDRPDPAHLRENVASLLGASTSFTHSLDRLRFLKQTWHVRIAAADLARLWPEEQVWRALSDVSDALVAGTRDVVWQDVCRQRGHVGPCPVSIIAMGKLGGRELNFSSDIDLIYVLDDEALEADEKLAARFGEALSRAMSDRMGRGSLYRVDLRLRPYGARGPLVPRMRAIEGYYARYAEGWEHLALVRSRVLIGNEGVAERWSRVREETCFQPQRGEWFVQDLLRMRSRIEKSHTDSDLKRGAGGIRDIEFVAQILQLLYGHKFAGLRTFSTLAALRALKKSRVIEENAAEELVSAYTFLRQVEHRIQLLGDQQTHSVPKDIAQREELAKRVGFTTIDAFEAALAMHRGHARTWYQTLLLLTEQSSEPREHVLNRAGALAPIVGRWIDDLPSSDSFYASLKENESSIDRIVAIAESAPVLIPQLRQYVAVTEQVMTGEILEDFDVASRFQAAGSDTVELAAAIKRGWLRAVARAALIDAADLGAELATLYDAALTLLLAGAGFRAVALGSFGAREMSPYSDLDVLFWRDGKLDHEHDEKTAQAVLTKVQALRRAGATIKLDLRLRPEGKKGRLVHNEDSLRQYEQASMEPWERLALGRTRAEGGVPELIHVAAYGRPLDPSTLASLVRMKRRVETERVPIQYRSRHIKLGPGGQDDVLWLVQLLWWKHIERLDKYKVTVIERLPDLQAVGAVNALEREQAEEAWVFFRRLRLHLALLGFNDEVLLENPEKLTRLGEVARIGGQNEVIAQFERHRQQVRGLFDSTIECLGG